MRTLPFRPAALSALAALLAASCSQLTDLPTLTEDDLQLKLAESSRVYAADGTLITTLHGEEDRTVIPLKRIPKHVQDAVIAIEDERYYEHEGVDWKAVVRAFLTNISEGEIREGGSTITQQYVKNVIIAPGETAEKTLERKIREAALARQLEKRLSKQEILERYLNTVYFGEGAYGIQAAAKTYFGKGASDLSLGEGALIAGLIRAPGDYDPYNQRKAAIKRRNLVLDKMVELGWAAPDRAARAQAKRLGLQPDRVKETYQAPYFLDYVQRLITWDPRFDEVGKNAAQRTRRLFQGGLRIHTTVDLDAQAAAEDAIDQVLTYETDPYASLVAIEPETGHIKAMVGGRDFFASRKEDPYAKLNLAILAEPGAGRVKVGHDFEYQAEGTGRQAGSAFKPFALAAAIKKGVPLSKQYKAASQMTFPGANAGGDWTVQNYEGSDFGNRLSLLEGTVNSVNVVYAQLILEIGAEAVVDVATEMGISTELTAVPSAALGTNEVNPLGMASAFGTFAADGVHHPPVAITKITDANGRVLYEDESEAEEVLEPAVAYLTTSALEQVILRGTGAAGQLGRPAAGKTGTAQEWRDAWFVGYTPDLVAAVWVGYPKGQIEMKTSCSVTVIGDREVCRPTRITVTGGSWPTQIWQAFMLRALAGIPASDFPTASGLVTVTIDTRNGCLASRFTPDEFRGTGTFAAGTAPKETCREPRDAVRVPDVFGFPLEDAVRLLEDEGFEVKAVEEPSSTYPPGRVIGQSPAAGERAPRGSTVVIEVSVKGEDNLDEVPDVLGMKRSDAIETLTDAGFDVRVFEEAESNPRAAKERRGRVWKQSPAGGSEVEKGSMIDIWVNPR